MKETNLLSLKLKGFSNTVLKQLLRMSPIFYFKVEDGQIYFISDNMVFHINNQHFFLLVNEIVTKPYEKMFMQRETKWKSINFTIGLAANDITQILPSFTTPYPAEYANLDDILKQYTPLIYEKLV
jgi:hypothetical protein